MKNTAISARFWRQHCIQHGIKMETPHLLSAFEEMCEYLNACYNFSQEVLKCSNLEFHWQNPAWSMSVHLNFSWWWSKDRDIMLSDGLATCLSLSNVFEIWVDIWSRFRSEYCRNRENCKVFTNFQAALYVVICSRSSPSSINSSTFLYMCSAVCQTRYYSPESLNGCCY